VHSATDDRSEVLASAYRESLRVAEELGARSVAFPAISAGAYGWPLDDAARVAVAAVRSHHPGAVTEVRFVLFGRRAYDAFRSALDA
jgi:O-acetyl-ADP-ribose deacetylase (regulator of RNase III)